MQPNNPQALENFAQQLQRSDARLQAGLVQSRLASVLWLPLLWLRQKLAPAAAQSLAVHWLPHCALGLTLLLLFSLPFASSGQNGILILAAALLTFLRVLLLDEKHPLGTLFALVLLFVAWGIVATGFSPFPKLSLLGYLKTISYFLAYLCFIVNLRSLAQIRLSIWVLVLSALVVGVYGLYQWQIKVPPLALWDDPLSQYKLTRVYSFLGNPNLLGGYLLPTLALTAGLALGRRNLLSWRALLLWPTGAVQVLCIYFTYSRGAWIALALSAPLALGLLLIVYWPMLARHRSFKPLLLLGLVAGLALGGWLLLQNPALMERLQSLFSGREHSSNNFRYNVWVSSLAIIQDYGWTGAGIGNKVFQQIYTYYMATGFKALSTYNVPLEIWVEMGIVGLLSFLAMLAAHSWRALRSLFYPLNTDLRLLLVAALVGLFALMAHGMVDTVFYRPAVQVLFWYLLALITVVTQAHVLLDSTVTD